jgi:Zn-dependent protease with chaperone function
MFGIPLLAVVSIAFYFGGPSIAAISLLIMLVLSTSIYRYSPKMMLMWYRCKAMPPAKHAEIDPALFFLASKFSIPYPKTCTFASAVPLVFTVGSFNNYSVVLSEGALDILDENEMKAVLTCEAAKIASGSVPVNTLVAFIAGGIVSLSNVAMWMSMLAGFGQEKDTAPRLARFLVMGLVSLPAALIVHLFSVKSTLRSDEMAARMMVNKSYLTGSLCVIDNYIQLRCTEDFNPGHANLFLLNPLRIHDMFDIYSSMFMSKPGIRQRVRLIEQTNDRADISYK